VTKWAASKAFGASEFDLSSPSVAGSTRTHTHAPPPAAAPTKLSKSKRIRMKRQAKKIESAIEDQIHFADDQMRNQAFGKALEFYDRVYDSVGPF
jgi:hypothetical protein